MLQVADGYERCCSVMVICRSSFSLNKCDCYVFVVDV